jgi:protein ImuB
MKTRRELYACVAAREFPAQAMLRVRPELRAQACAVLDGEPPLETVCSLNAQARRLGLARGMTRVEAETFPQTALLVRARGEEENARAALLACAAQFTPRVEECGRDGTYVCVLDIAGTGQLFGPPEKLAAHLTEQLRAIGLSASIAVAGNFHAARCMALAHSAGVHAIAVGEERTPLASLPLAVLDLTEAQAETFTNWGLATLGDLAGLPEASLVARMGQDSKRLRQMALGAWPHLFVPLEEELALEERIDLDTPVELLDSLLFVLRVLVEQLIARAADHLVGLASITVRLKLEESGEHVRMIRPALPGSDLHLWMKLVQLDLAAHPPPAAILAVVVKAEPGNRGKVQLGLFSPQTPEAERLDITLARLRRLVGEDCVGAPTLQDTHRPAAFQVAPFRVSDTREDVLHAVESRSTRGALRMLRPAEGVSLTLRGKTPEAFVFRAARYRVERAYGPWMASGEWWNPTLWAAQQWDVMAQNAAGELLYGCLAYEPLEKTWAMVGLYD